MRAYLLPLAALAYLPPAVLPAGQPAIDGKVDVAPYRLVTLTAKDVGPKAGTQWKVRPLDPAADPKAVDLATDRKARTLKFVAPPGRYAVTLSTVGPRDATPDDPSVFELDDAEVVVTVGDPCGVAPAPPPTPKPQPDPGPVEPRKLFVVAVEETSEAVPARGAFFTDPTLTARMKEKGHKLRVVDKDVVGPDGKPPADVTRFLDAAKAAPYPQVFLVDERGRTVFTGPFPKTPAALVALLQQYGG